MESSADNVALTHQNRLAVESLEDLRRSPHGSDARRPDEDEGQRSLVAGSLETGDLAAPGVASDDDVEPTQPALRRRLDSSRRDDEATSPIVELEDIAATLLRGRDCVAPSAATRLRRTVSGDATSSHRQRRCGTRSPGRADPAARP